MSQSFITPDLLQHSIDQGIVMGASMVENVIKVIWKSHWSHIIFFILCIAVLKIFTGRIGSLIYNIIYFGLLIIILLIGGLKILFSPAFDFIYSLLYPIAFFLTGRILRKVR
jgi:hypothetical protein